MSGQAGTEDVIVGGDRPTKEVTETISGVRVKQTIQAAILNFDDPDVKVLHTYLPSIGSDHAEIRARGRAKARYSWRDVPQSLVDSAKPWARLLAAFPGTKLDIKREQRQHFLGGGDANWAGWAHPLDGVSVFFRGDSVRILVQDNGKGQPLSVATEIRGKAMARFDLKAFVRDAKRRLRKARKRLDEVGSLGVTLEED